MKEILVIYVRPQAEGDTQQEIVAARLQIITKRYPLSVHKGMAAFSKLKASEITMQYAICQDNIFP